MSVIYFIARSASANDPGGYTVSKRAELPKGDFRITEYCWGRTSLWFVDEDKFTPDERRAAYRSFVRKEFNLIPNPNIQTKKGDRDE